MNQLSINCLKQFLLMVMGLPLCQFALSSLSVYLSLEGLLSLTYLSFPELLFPAPPVPSYWSTLQELKWENHGLRYPSAAKGQAKTCGIQAFV